MNNNSFKNILFIILLAFLILIAYKIQNILILFFASFVIASALNPVVNKLNQKMPRLAAVSIVGITGFIIVMLFLIPFINVLVTQSILFLEHLPEFWDRIELFIDQKNLPSIIGAGSEQLSKLGTGILPDMDQIMNSISSIGQNILNSSIAITQSFFNSLIFVITSAMIIFYMLLDKDYLKGNILKLFPESSKLQAAKILEKISKRVGGFVISQLIMMFTIGFLLTIGLAIAGIKFSLILGLLAGVLDIIPVVGPLLAAVIIVLVSLAQKPVLALIAIIIYASIQWLLDAFVKPFVLSKFLNLHSLTLIFSLLAGGILLGVAGVILAPAFAVTICVLLDELYINKINVSEITENY